MIVRAFRLTDKLGNALLKGLIWLSEAIVGYAWLLGSSLAALVMAILAVAAFVAQAILTVLKVIAAVLLTLWQILLRVTGGEAGGWPSALPGRRAEGAEARRLDSMLRRAEDLSETVVLVEDPLKARNRTLSALLVVALAAVVGLLIWATSPRGDVPVIPPVIIAPAAGETSPAAEFTPFATAVPTVTPRPEALRIGGSLAYTVRDGGQDDIWMTVIGFENPVRITDHPDDDRDPAWSPNGRYLAFASHRDGNWELYVQDVQTGTVTRLTYTLGFEGSPAWSPDGQWLVYEAYNEDNLDIYIIRVDGTQGPIRLTYHPAPDFSPAWSPGGREIAYVSWREGNKDIYILSLDDPSEDLARNLTATPDLHEDHPTWSPDGLSLAYSARVDGLEAVYVLPANGVAGQEPELIDRGRMPAWAPDGGSLVYAIDQGSRTLIVAGMYRSVGMVTQAVALPGRGGSPTWTSWRPQIAPPGPLATSQLPYTEQITYAQAEPPYYRLVLLGDVQAPNPYLSDRVNDSFAALREAVLQKTGEDYLGNLEDAFWPLDRLPEPGQERLNWHLTGRAFALNRNLIYGFPPPLEIVREDVGVYTFWRVFARAAVQDGQLGEPLRELPWDFAARSGGDVRAYEEGGRYRGAIPAGYYVDLTQLFADYGWYPLPADRSWRYNFGGVLYWEAVKTDGLSWEEAMLEIYGSDELNAFLTAPTALPTRTLAPPTPTPAPTRTPTPVPPDQGAGESG
ncbi:MAG: hypothetical protein HPY64_06650 [Anaerolineae bacterium]|nr:hypothetical protein [Anaerolineae bacterium]